MIYHNKLIASIMAERNSRSAAVWYEDDEMLQDLWGAEHPVAGCHYAAEGRVLLRRGDG
jgi:hypothetical protein